MITLKMYGKTECGAEFKHVGECESYQVTSKGKLKVVTIERCGKRTVINVGGINEPQRVGGKQYTISECYASDSSGKTIDHIM